MKDANWNLTYLALGLLAILGLTGCVATQPEAPPDDVVVIDVRTAAEFDSGHLAGAVNIDLQSEGFIEQVKQLPTSGDYLLYCRSGNRSAQAAAEFSRLGYGSVIDAGSMSAAGKLLGREVVIE